MSDEPFELVDDPEPGDAPSKRRVPCALLGTCAVLLALCLLSVLGAVFQYSLRTRLASYDTRLRLGVAGSESVAAGELEDGCSVVRSRLRQLGILARVLPAGSEIHVELDQVDAQRALDVMLRHADLRFLLVVGEAELSGEGRAAEIAAIRAARAKGNLDSGPGRYTAFPWHPGARGGESGGWVLLETEGTIRGSDFSSFGRAIDDRGLPCVGFKMSASGRRKLYALTSNNVGRQLAIVFDGQVRSAPVIRGPIGKRGIIEGGSDGWNERELQDLLVLLDSGSLPFRLELVKSEPIGR